jgi:hypothetical protein
MFPLSGVSNSEVVPSFFWKVCAPQALTSCSLAGRVITPCGLEGTSTAAFPLQDTTGNLQTSVMVYHLSTCLPAVCRLTTLTVLAHPYSKNLSSNLARSSPFLHYSPRVVRIPHSTTVGPSLWPSS